MRKVFILMAALTVAANSFAFRETTYLKLLMSGQKIGFAVTSTGAGTFGGRPAEVTDTKTTVDAGLLGQSVSIQMNSKSFRVDKRIVRMEIDFSSSGRSQRIEANFSGRSVNIGVDNNGARTTKTLEVPEGGEVVDDAMTALIESGVSAGVKMTFYVLDPMTVTLIKNVAELKGAATFKRDGQDVPARLVEITEPRAVTKVFLDEKGEFLKSESLMGMEMWPCTKEEALGKSTNTTPIDLAEAAKIHLDKPLGAIETLKSVTLSISGADLSRLPSDSHQKVTKGEQSWTVKIAPADYLRAANTSIKKAAKDRGYWLKSSLNLPAQNVEFRTLAKRIVGKNQDVRNSVTAIHNFVYDTMRPNAGIGVLRDAAEILRTKEGVCRDYATLTTTLLRAAGIPARLASGLVYYNGEFYYHAWSEFWNGHDWLGVDATRPVGKVTPGHMKLAQGNVEDAFAFTFLTGVKIRVLEIKR